MSEAKENRIASANAYIRKFRDLLEQITSGEVREVLKETISVLGNLRDCQYLFDSGEKELIRLYERYLPYLLEILENYERLEESGNYDAIVANRTHLLKTVRSMNDVIRSVTKLLPQDEIDEANAKKRAEELRRQLEEQSRSVIE